ncbi:response regulator [Devosia sp. ZB163]|uniref:HD domain-containing phosphohydrolase n=1 Tax=Devosia sp. ZB163 TaxID=3025938 RepID=UPI002362069D|nr:HD domain-containing phosphohydrolase [Devosia sp. ZB163]MDC9823096.1 response regulator [Devosia sp. ZB163]
MRVLIVDDSKSSLAFLGHVLGSLDGIEIQTCLRPSLGLAAAAAAQFDLVLVDNVMPEMDGVELTRRLRAEPAYRSVPIVMVTSDISPALRLKAVAAGATDFVNKPFDSTELQARVKNLLALRQAQIELADRAAWLAREVESATRHLVDREEEIIWRLARAIEYRDGDTGGHVSRVALISSLIAGALGLSPERCRLIYLAAPLHDIGKIGIPDAVLGKPGKLTAEELTVMRQHVTIGARILEKGSSELVRTAELIAQSHHERWDGTGYPGRIAGTDIPIEARIVAIADVFDALCSERPYKKAWPVEAAYREVASLSGTHFDPACVAAFERMWPEIEAQLVTSDPVRLVS